MSSDFDNLSEDQQDEVARARIKEILKKPKLEEGDAATVAACVAFIGSSSKMADKFSQALLDAAESLTSGLCVRCGAEPPGKGPSSCMICQSIRSVQTMKLVKSNNHETLEERTEREGDEKYREERGLDFEGKPITHPGEGEPLKDLETDIEADLQVGELSLEVLEGSDEEATKALKKILGEIPRMEKDQSTEEEQTGVICPGCEKVVPATITCISCGVNLETKTSTDQETETVEVTVDPDEQLHQEYPHTFSAGRLNKSKATATLADLETMANVTEEDVDAIEHIRAHLGLPGPIPKHANCRSSLEIKVDAPVTKPWTARELEALENNKHLQPSMIAKYVALLSNRTPEEIEAKIEETKQ